MTTAHASIYADLPRIVTITGRSDSGEYGGASCPHCGAAGRYVIWFVCEDGTSRGAMAGCLKKFPMHPFAKRALALQDKRAELAEQNAKTHGTRQLASWDQQVLDAIEAYADGNLSEQDAYDQIALADSRKASWMRSRGYGRR